MRLSSPLVAVATSAVVLAQSTPISKAAVTITEDDIRWRINVITHDSLGGRYTPSPGLDPRPQWAPSSSQPIVIP